MFDNDVAAVSLCPDKIFKIYKCCASCQCPSPVTKQ